MDLDAYFARIDYNGPREPTLAVLNAICTAQPSTIVYENFDPFLGRVPQLSQSALQAKLVEQQRGGYCFELNLLLREVLLALGMKVTCLAARVVWMAPPDAPMRARTHMLLQVETSDAAEHPQIVDLGFGGQIFAGPFHFQPGLVQRTPLGAYRVAFDGKTYALETELPQGWMPLYRFNLDPHLPVDYEPTNWFTATHPTSIFRHNLLLQTLTSEGRTGLLNDRLVVQRHGQAPQTRRIDKLADFKQVIDEVFHLELPAPLDDIYERVPKGLDGFVVPSLT